MIAKKEVSLDHFFCDICGAVIGPVEIIQRLGAIRVSLNVQERHYQREEEGLRDSGSHGPVEGQTEITICNNCLAKLFTRYDIYSNRTLSSDLKKLRDFFIKDICLHKEDDTDA